MDMKPTILLLAKQCCKNQKRSGIIRQNKKAGFQAMFDDWDAEDRMLQIPDITLLRAYCPECDTTTLFESLEYPQRRGIKPALCPDCKKELGEKVEAETTIVLHHIRGDVGDRIFSGFDKTPPQWTQLQDRCVWLA